MGPLYSSDKCGKAVLVLEDECYSISNGFGSSKEVSGEVIFSTSIVEKLARGDGYALT